MALTTKKHERFYSTTGSDSDKVSSSKLTEIQDLWDQDVANGNNLNLLNDPTLGPIIYQLQQMQDEIDYLRTEISTNKDKTSFPGFGTDNSTALAGDTSLLQLGTTSSTALAGDTKTVTFGSNTTSISFADMASVTKKGKTTYSVDLTITTSGVSKSVTLTLT